jgi:hypothetical protein
VLEAALDLVAPDGRVCGTFQIRCRIGRETDRDIPALTYLLPEQSSWGVRTLSLLEDNEYRYEVVLNDAAEGELRFDPGELFDPDDLNGMEGRLRPGLYTGALTIEVSDEAGVIGRCDLEVRSRKLNYLEDYRSMLSSIAREGAELLLQRFSPTEIAALAPDTESDAQTLYQRFAFLSSLLQESSFQAAIATILSRPHESSKLRRSFDPLAGVLPAAPCWCVS